MLDDLNSEKSFTTTVDYSDYPAFAKRAHVLESTNGTIWNEVKHAWNVLRESVRTKTLLLDSTSGRVHPDLLAAILIGFLPKRRQPVIVFMGDMWQKDPGLPGLVQKVVIRLAGRSVSRFALQSTDEVEYFPKAWGISNSKLRFVPYFYTFTERDLQAPKPNAESFIFSGGDSHRDYKTFLEVAGALPEKRFVIATRTLAVQSLPPNVRAGPVSRNEFIRLMRAAAAVVVPLRRDLIRAAGQQTYLNAMLLGKPTIITDTLGVRDYVQNNDIAWVVEGSVESYILSLREIFDPANQGRVKEITARARQKVLQNFTFERHTERLLMILDEAIEEAQAKTSHN